MRPMIFLFCCSVLACKKNPSSDQFDPLTDLGGDKRTKESKSAPAPLKAVVRTVGDIFGEEQGNDVAMELKYAGKNIQIDNLILRESRRQGRAVVVLAWVGSTSAQFVEAVIQAGEESKLVGLKNRFSLVGTYAGRSENRPGTNYGFTVLLSNARLVITDVPVHIPEPPPQVVSTTLAALLELDRPSETYRGKHVELSNLKIVSTRATEHENEVQVFVNEDNTRGDARLVMRDIPRNELEKRIGQRISVRGLVDGNEKEVRKESGKRVIVGRIFIAVKEHSFSSTLAKPK